MRILNKVSILILCLFIGACGFQPLYGTSTGVDKERLTRFEIARIPERNGQILRNELLDLFNVDASLSPKYRLVVNAPNFTSETIGVDRTSESATKTQVVASAGFQILNKTTNKLIHKGQARTFVAYNILDSQFETITARSDAEDRALKQIANEIMRQTAIAMQDIDVR